MTCQRDNVIKIFRGDDTNWNGDNLLNFVVTSETVDLSTMTAKFIVGSIVFDNIPLTTGEFTINFTHEQTASMPWGLNKGVIQILDASKRIKTVTNAINLFVTSEPFAEQSQTINVTVPETSPVEITLTIGGGSGGGSWGSITGDIQNQEDLQAEFDTKMDKLGGTFTGDVTLAQGVSLKTQVGELHDVNDNIVLGGKDTNYGLYVAPDGSAAALVGNNSLKDIITTADVKSTYSASGTDPVNGVAVASALSPINAVIPSQATAENQLADKNFVNSSISTNTANFIGTFENVSALESYSGTVTNNDYAFVINSVVTDNGNDWATLTDLNAYDKTLLTNFDYAWVENGNKFDLYRFDIVLQTWGLRAENVHKADVTLNTAYNRYKATVAGGAVTWGYEYTLNNSSFTADQWAAINSGATTTNIGQIATNTSNITSLQTNKLDVTTAASTYLSKTDAASTYLRNKSTSSTSVNILGTSTYSASDSVAIGSGASQRQHSVSVGSNAFCTDTYAVSIGSSSYARQYCVSVGCQAETQGSNVRCVSVGYAAKVAMNVSDAIQLGTGTNSDSNSMQVWNYKLLDRTTGKIPDARLPIIDGGDANA